MNSLKALRDAQERAELLELANQDERELFIAFVDQETLDLVHSIDFDGTIMAAADLAKKYCEDHWMSRVIVSICPAGKSWALHTFKR